jgi:hypothetical protein
MNIRLSLERLHSECIGTSSDEEFDEMSYLMVVVTFILS